jgi:hypothetical protein
MSLERFEELASRLEDPPRDYYHRKHSPDRCHRRHDRWKRYGCLHGILSLAAVLLCAAAWFAMPYVQEGMDRLEEKVALARYFRRPAKGQQRYPEGLPHRLRYRPCTICRNVGRVNG